jgi:hypothetical protein
MSAASCELPSGRVLAGWWRNLASWKPRRLWLAHLILHRLEILAEVRSHTAADLLAPGVFRWLCRQDKSSSVEQIADGLHLDRKLVRQAVAVLATRGHLVSEGDRWRVVAEVTELPEVTHRERRCLSFLDGRPPVFFPLSTSQAVPLSPTGGWRFDLGFIQHCIDQSPEWKRRHLFPEDLQGIVCEPNSQPSDWTQVTIDHPEQLWLVLAEQASDVLVFPTRPNNWPLPGEPLAKLPLDAPLLAQLTSEPNQETCRQAWLIWCKEHGLGSNEAESCRLELVGHRLLIGAASRLQERLRQFQRSDLWLLVGLGRAKQAVCIDVGMERSRS